MPEITLDPMQAQIFRAAEGDVVLRGPDGQLLGRGQRMAWTADEIAELEKRLDSSGPWRTTNEVLQRLKSSETP